MAAVRAKGGAAAEARVGDVEFNLSDEGKGADKGKGKEVYKGPIPPLQGNPIRVPGKGVITDSDYEANSDYYSSDDNSHPESEASKLLNGHPDNLKKAPKKLLEEVLDLAKFAQADYSKRASSNPDLKVHLRNMIRKHDLILEELEKIDRGEREDNIKGKEKKN